MGPVSPRRACLLAFTTAAVTLFTQVLAHRIVAAKLLNNFAFLIISLTMLGFALSGVVLTRWLAAFLPRLPEVLNLSAVAFAVSLIGCSAGFYAADTGAQYLVDFGRWLPLSLLFAFPFAFCGLSLGLLLSAPELPTRRVYAFDLAGSALGAYAVIPSISAGGVEASLLAGAGLLLVVTFILAPPRAPRVRAAVAGGLVVVALCAAFRGRVFDMYYPDASLLADARQPGSGVVIEHVAWDPVARIEVSRIPPPDPQTMFYPSHIGSNRAFLDRIRRVITQNNWAFTYAIDYDGRRESLAGLEETIYASAYEARGHGRGDQPSDGSDPDRHVSGLLPRVGVGPARPPRERGGPQLPRDPRRALRRHPAERRRLLRGHGRRRPRVLGELPVHRRGLRPLPVPPDRGRDPRHDAPRVRAPPGDAARAGHRGGGAAPGGRRASPGAHHDPDPEQRPLHEHARPAPAVHLRPGPSGRRVGRAPCVLRGVRGAGVERGADQRLPGVPEPRRPAARGGLRAGLPAGGRAGGRRPALLLPVLGLARARRPSLA